MRRGRSSWIEALEIPGRQHVRREPADPNYLLVDDDRLAKPELGDRGLYRIDGRGVVAGIAGMGISRSTGMSVTIIGLSGNILGK
jgi:hypothetical protein